MYIGLKTKNLRNMRNTIYLEIGEHVNEVGFKRKLGLLHSFTNEVVRHVNHHVWEPFRTCLGETQIARSLKYIYYIRGRSHVRTDQSLA